MYPTLPQDLNRIRHTSQNQNTVEINRQIIRPRRNRNFQTPGVHFDIPQSPTPTTSENSTRLGAGWTASFLAKVYPKFSHYLIKEFLQAVVEVSIVELLAVFVTFGAESFVKGPAVLLTEGVQNLRLDGLLTLIAITHGNLGGLMKLTRCPEQMREKARKLDMKKATDPWNKIRVLRHTVIQYLLQQNRFETGEDETIEREEDVRRHVGGMPLLTDLSLAMRADPLALIRGATEFVTVIYGPAVTFAFPDVKVEAYRRSVLHLNLISAVDGSS